ncbi:MAG: serine/threonine-protein phosphatase, partial [Bacteroidetes bacterium]|nr:serine/threonine-protein phosphatase [Bacteroidota bacterium]
DKEIQQLIVSGQQSELRKQRFVILFIAAALVLLGALAILLFSMNRFKKRANRELSLRNKEILQQKEVIARKNRDITDSLEYARTIQESALTPMEQIREILGEFFIVYKPKDIVSGDFYWAALPGQGKFAWAAADCTGHGVPGALMSILGISLLNEIVIEKKTEAPDLVLNELRLGVVKCLGQLSDRNIQKDGIDIVLCVFDRAKMTISFAGANTPLLHISKNNAVLYKGDKQPAGYYTGELRPFTRVDIPVCNGDMIYAFSDGFQDQFGGADGEKYRYNNLKQLLQEIHELSMEEQRTVLESRFSEWISHTDPRTGEKFEQIDDVLIFGVRI